MFFFLLPVGVDYRARRWPVVTFTLMGINVLVYLVTLLLYFNSGREVDVWVFENLWLIPAKSTWYTYVTSLFVHAGILHLLGNMVYLFLFGSCVEDLIGRVKFAIFYLLGGLAACFAHIATTPAHFESIVPLGGASGAITACIGGFLLFLARTKIEFKWVFFLLFRVWSGDFFLPAWLVISLWFGKDLLLAALTILGGAEGGGVAFAAHVGGFLWGLAAISLERLWQGRQSQAEEAEEVAAATPTAGAGGEAASVFLFLNGAQAGPFTLTQIGGMFALGAIPADACYWHEPTSEWRSVAELQNPAAG